MAVQILNGNELLIQGGLEAGFQLYTGYPGSPLADFFNILHERKDELHAKGVRVVLANSEAHAAAMASGAKMAHHNVMVAMKSMGLHVASDALSVGNFANPGATDAQGHKSGVVIVVGDDPWSISTSTPADSRYLYKHLHIPFLEPSTPQELKDWMAIALELSRESSVYVGVLLTTFMAEGGGRVEIGEEKVLDRERVLLDPTTFNLAEHVMVPPNSLGADIRMARERFPRYLAALSAKKLDRTFGNPGAPLAVISTGAAFETLKQVLEENDLLTHVHLYKVAGAYALDEDALLPFLRTHRRILVVEEKRGFLEAELKDLLARHHLSAEVWGKRIGDVEGMPSHGGLSYELIHQGLERALKAVAAPCALHALPSSVILSEAPARRLPTFCPGCPHRETLSLMKELRADLIQQGIPLVSHGDVGCYSLSFLEPFKEMHDLSAMGQGGAMGAGTDIFTRNPSVVLMGDSTFFHSGMTAISNSVQMGHNITYILLDNDNTAMTGHQVTPRTGMSVEGEPRPRQDMLAIARSLGVDASVEVNPSDRYFYKNLLTDYVLRPGVKVIVSNKECGLTFHGRKKREERALFRASGTQPVRTFYQINTLACEDCRVCVEMTGCPGLTQTRDAYGTKVMIDPQICVADSYCTKLKACPSFERVDVRDYHPTMYAPTQTVLAGADHVPAPRIRHDFARIAAGEAWRAVVIGVGGSGVTTISRVLAEAARPMGGRNDLDFKFVDQKGLAQRNGSVTSHLALFAKGRSHGQTVPLARAQVVVSPDLLEGARALPFLAPEGILVVDEDYQVPLSLMLDDEAARPQRSPEELREELRLKLGDRLLMAPFKRLCEERFQRAVYASAALLGVQFQAGLLPFTEADMHTAFAAALPGTELGSNLEAFQMGREWFIHRQAPLVAANNEHELLHRSTAMVALPWQRAARFTELLSAHTTLLEGLFPALPKEHLAHYVHDIIVYDQGQGLHAYLEDARVLARQISEPRLQEVALRTLAKTYWIKDEVFVAHLMVSPLKTERDRATYGRLGKSFRVHHINRPSFNVADRKVEFDFSPAIWMLHLMRGARFLRKLMPHWHQEERRIAGQVRQELLRPGHTWESLKALDNIKGYREVRHAKAQALLRAGGSA